MCLNLSGLLMRNIAIDFGTVNTLIAIKGRGIVLREPSAVAVSADERREPLAFGSSAARRVVSTSYIRCGTALWRIMRFPQKC